MKFLLTLFAILLVAVVIANLAVTEPGYVLLSYGKSSIELPLIDFLVALLLLFFLSYLLIRFLLGLRRTPAGLKKLNANRKSTNSRKGLLQGLIEMAEGNWQKAEKHLVRSAGNSDLPVLSYLAAAHAAQRQENPDRRDDYLRMASQSDPKAEVAIGLAQAELQIRSKQFEEALATLQHLESQAPKHRFVKKLLARLHYEMKNWDALKTLIPDLRKQQTVTEKELLKFETATYAAQLRQTDSLKETESIWQSLSKDSRNQPQLAQHYFKALIRFGESEKAEQLLRKSLNQNLDNRLLETYGSLELKNPQQALMHTGQWLEKTPDNPVLLTAAARLSTSAKLWGKARSLLRESINVKPSAMAWQTLADLESHLGEQEAAKQSYAQGLKLLIDQRT